MFDSIVFLFLLVLCLTVDSDCFADKFWSELSASRDSSRKVPLLNLSELDIPHMKTKWTDHFLRLNETQIDSVHEHFQYLVRWFARHHSAPERRQVISSLNKYRSVLPYQLRWILAAAEVDEDMSNENTFEDIRSALKQTENMITLNRFLSMAIPSSIFYYPLDSGAQIRNREISLSNTREFAFLYGNWMSYISSVDSGLIDPFLTEKLLEWTRAISISYFQLPTSDLAKLVLKLNKDLPLKFFDPIKKHDFLEKAFLLMDNIFWSLGVDRSSGEDKYIPEYYKSDFYKIQERVSTWMQSDLAFLIKNYDQLSRRGLVSLPAIFLRTLSQSDLENVGVILREKKVFAESYWLGSMLWLKNRGASSARSEIEGLARFYAFQGLIRATAWGNGIKMKIDGFNVEYLSSIDFKIFVKELYEIYNSGGILSSSEALSLLATQTLRIKDMSDQEWGELEWSRLQACENNLSRSIFHNTLKAIVLNSKATLQERVLGGTYLRAKNQAPDLSEIAIKLKDQARGGRFSRYFRAEIDIWNQRDGELVQIISGLRPSDPDLTQYLAKSYVENRPIGFINSRSALKWLAINNQRPADVRKELVARLKKTSVGDTMYEFQSLLHLFPGEGKNIVEIIYNHRKAPSKLVQLLGVLVTETSKNLKLIDSITLGLESHRHSSIGGALYQGLTLTQWIQQEVNKIKKPSMACPQTISLVRDSAGIIKFG